MKIAVLKEKEKHEHRVAITPEIAGKFKKMGFEIYVESNAGLAASYTNESYESFGAKISKIPLEIIADADIIFKITPSESELEFMKPNSTIITVLEPFDNKSLIRKYAQNNIRSFAVEFIPRISRAQSMDVLSSQSNLAGFRAVIEAIHESTSCPAMMMTAAGTIAPSKLMVLGAGVAGLQAIATARRLGAIVCASDVRAAAKEQVMSLGAKFIEVEEKENLESKSGYAMEASESYKRKQAELIAETIKNQDIVITTALIPGKPAPKLISAEMVKSMKPGSIIVDMATQRGGNCELSSADEIILTDNQVKIIGHSNLAARVATDASKLYANNMFNFTQLLIDSSGNFNLNMSDEIIASSLITNDGMIVNEKLKD